jgi:hypothetical protein
LWSILLLWLLLPFGRRAFEWCRGLLRRVFWAKRLAASAVAVVDIFEPHIRAIASKIKHSQPLRSSTWLWEFENFRFVATTRQPNVIRLGVFVFVDPIVDTSLVWVLTWILLERHIVTATKSFIANGMVTCVAVLFLVNVRFAALKDVRLFDDTSVKPSSVQQSGPLSVEAVDILMAAER